MWLFVFFDLPTLTKAHRKAAARFRKDLEASGFSMEQFSVYTRHCPSREHMQTYQKRVLKFLPRYGRISMLAVTDKQYSDRFNYVNLDPDLETRLQKKKRLETTLDARQTTIF